jgi:hypothetical protein
LVFRESIIVVASEAWISFIKSKQSDLNILEMPKKIAIYGAEINHWDNIERLKSHLSTKNKYRTKAKQDSIVDTLLEVISSKSLTIAEVIHNLVQKLYTEHFHLGHSNTGGGKQVSKDEKTNFIEGNEYFEHLERFCISFTDAVKKEASSQGLDPLNLFSKYHDEVGTQRQTFGLSTTNYPSYGSSTINLNGNNSICLNSILKY